MARKSRKNNDISNDVVSNVSRFTIHTAFYIRLSVEDNKNRGNSIEHQQMLLRNFVAVNPEFHVVKHILIMVKQVQILHVQHFRKCYKT